MPVPGSIGDLSQTPALNSPAGSESPALIDDYIRTISAFIAILRDNDAQTAFAKSLLAASNAADARAVLDVLSTAQVKQMIPVGSMIWWPMAYPPAGWLVCDGSLLSTTVYADLFAALGAWYGTGGGGTQFRIPDLRGVFVRGLDLGRGIDPDSGRLVGSLQSQSYQSHQHTGTTGGAGEHVHDYNAREFAGNTSRITASDSITTGTMQTSSAGYHSHTFTTSVEGGAETRPTNVTLLPIIKY